MIRMFLIDMDGTCLDPFKHISRRSLTAMKVLQEKGIHCVAASGRCLSALPEAIRSDPSFRYVITSNGSRLRDRTENRLLFEELISPARSETILDCVSKMAVTPAVQADDHSFVQGGSAARMIGRMIFGSDMNHTRIVSDLKPAVRFGCEKITFFYRTIATRSRMMKYLEAYDFNITDGIAYSEICSAQAGKGNALKALQEHLGITKEETACIGDADNDISMFEGCGLRFAPENAIRVLKEKADHVVPDNSHDAVWHAARILLEQDPQI